MNRREHPVQVTIKRYLERVLPGAIVFSVKNESVIVSKVPGVRMGVIARERAAGVRKGFFDLGCLLPDGGTFWVEVKDPERGIWGEEQQRIHDQAIALGHACCVADCIENVRWGLLQFGISHRDARGQPAHPWRGRLAKLRDPLNDMVPF